MTTCHPARAQRTSGAIIPALWRASGAHKADPDNRSLRSRLRDDIVFVLKIALCLLGIAACTFDEKAIAVAPSQVVVHSVLDAGTNQQEVLVERTLSGSVSINNSVRYDVNDPINTGGGVPVSKALVTITGPDGIATGFEIQYAGKASTYGAGRYVVSLRPRPGARYTLAVRAGDGSLVTGSTIVPNITPVTLVPGTPLVPFNRDRDTLALAWNTVPFARSYGFRTESPFGAFMLFTDTTRLKLSGDIRNVFASDFQRLFIPGFQQTYTVFAVDTNYFDYYRSRNDPFTGSGIINRLTGGIGLFGATATVATRTLDVTQQPIEPALEGEYEIAQGPVSPTGRPYIDVMRLYVETPGTAFASLSGWYARDRRTNVRDGIAGARDGTRIELELLINQDSRQRFARFIGTQSGDSLVGAYDFVVGKVVLKKTVPGTYSDKRLPP
jgi:hypothetical protein